MNFATQDIRTAAARLVDLAHDLERLADLHVFIAERDRALARADALLRDLAKDELLPKWLRDHIAAYLREREGGHDE
jgi:hypothetical protein